MSPEMYELIDNIWVYGPEETRESKEFGRLNRLRGQLLHGREQSLAQRDITVTRNLLEKSLAKDLGVSDQVEGRPSTPKFEAALRFGYTERPI